jgi:hypothetical protein
MLASALPRAAETRLKVKVIWAAPIEIYQKQVKSTKKIGIWGGTLTSGLKK